MSKANKSVRNTMKGAVDSVADAVKGAIDSAASLYLKGLNALQGKAQAYSAESISFVGKKVKVADQALDLAKDCAALWGAQFHTAPTFDPIKSPDKGTLHERDINKLRIDFAASQEAGLLASGMDAKQAEKNKHQAWALVKAQWAAHLAREATKAEAGEDSGEAEAPAKRERKSSDQVFVGHARKFHALIASNTVRQKGANLTEFERKAAPLMAALVKLADEHKVDAK